MAQSGFTPIQLYRTTTAAAVPSAANLADGELAINTNDGRLFYKDSGGAVQTIASTSSTGGVFAPGTVSAPGITFTGDTNTGIYSPAADTIAFTEGGVEAMRIDASGNVGIGTASPAYRLTAVGGATQISPGTSAQEGVRIQRASGVCSFTGINNDNNAFNALSFATGASEAMRIDSSGNVGIGTSSPGRRLSVVGTDTNNLVAMGNSLQGLAAGTGNGGAIYFGISTNSATDPTAAIESSWGAAGNDPQIHLGVTRGGNKTRYSAFWQDNSLRLYTADTERMRIDGSGNVGIGTSSPTQRLTVSGQITSSVAGASILQTAIDSTNSINWQVGSDGSNIYAGTQTNHALRIVTNNAERFRIGTAGQFGVGGANYGTSGQVLTSNGSGSAPSWQNAGGTANGLLLNVQAFTSSGTYTRTAGATRAVVIAVGGGGGGGGSNTGTGGTGGTTSFGSHVTAVGGSGGAANSGFGGNGGTGGTGATIAIRGTPGRGPASGGSGGGGGQGGANGVSVPGSVPSNQTGTAGVRGGGGSGGTNRQAAGCCSSITFVGAGGGQGETAVDYISSGLGTTETVTIGAGGTGGAGTGVGGAGGAGYVIVYEYS